MLQQVVQSFCLRGIPCRILSMFPAVADGPADFWGVRFRPPAVQLGKIQAAVDAGADRQLARIVDRIKRLLPAFRIEILTEIPLPVEQTDSDYGNTHVAGRLHPVACYISQSTRVDGQRFTQHELHAEIGNQTKRGAWMLVLEPCVCIVGFPILAKQIVETKAKLRLPQRSFDLLISNLDPN